MLDNHVPDAADILNAQRLADKHRKTLSDDTIKQLRIQAKYDRMFLGTYLGYDKFSPKLHGEICIWIQDTATCQYRLILIPRSHYKSTVVTVTDSIGTALPDDLGTAPYPYNLGTNVRICIAHDIADMAQKFLRIIVQHFCTNPYLIAIFPECVPDPKRHRINLRELELPRTAVWAESTFDTMAVGARGQGNHYNKLKLDDIYGETARDSEAERNAHIQWFDNVQSFLITPATDQIDIVGTRWAFDDVYAHAMKTYGADLKTFVRSVYERDKKGDWLLDDNGNKIPIFPEQFTLKSLDILKKNPIVWNAQYINDPREGAAKFQPHWKKFFTRRGRDIAIHTPETPFQAGGTEYVRYEELDRVILVDPALDGLSGIVVTGMDSKKRVFTLEAIKKSLPPEQLRDLIFSLVAKYNPRIVAIEEVLFSALFEVWFRTEMALRGIRFKIEPVKTNQKAKELRVNGLANWFETGMIFFHESQKDLAEEHDQFGATDDYHMLDALAYGPRVWRPGGRAFLNNSASSLNSSNNGRSNLTGYSKI